MPPDLDNLSFGLYQQALELSQAGTPFALSAVIWSRGSTPQKAGAKALFKQAGGVLGTLGGGCLEAEAQQRALRALDTQEPSRFELRLDDIDGWDDGLVCGGSVRILSLPTIEANRKAYQDAVAAEAAGQPGILLTVLDHPTLPMGQAFWIGETDFAQKVADISESELRDCMKAEKAMEINCNGITVFLEPLCLAPRLIIAGGGHIGKAVAAGASRSGFSVTVIDDRPAFANSEHIPEADSVICGDIPATVAQQPLDDHSYVVIVTRGHQHDGKVLAACVGSQARYIGMIGSQRKSLILRKRMVEDGYATQEQIDRVISPIGLDLGARTVEEIAVSIVAQLITVRRRADLAGPALTQGTGKV